MSKEPTIARQRSLDIINQIYQQADRFSKEGKYADALRGFQMCLDWATENRFPISIELIQDVLTHIGTCFADLGQHENAIYYYQAIEAVLLLWKEKKGDLSNPVGNVPITLKEYPSLKRWEAVLPGWFFIPTTFDPFPALAKLYDCFAISSHHLGNKAQTNEYFGRAVEMNLDLGKLDQAIYTMRMAASLRQQSEDWLGLVETGQGMAILSERAGDTAHQVQALRFLAQAHTELGNFFIALENLTTAVRIGSSNDPATAQDKIALRKIVDRLIPEVKEKNHPKMWQPILDAERLVGHPEWLEHEALAQLVEGLADEPLVPSDSQQPIVSTQIARLTLERFAFDHCGPSKFAKRKGLLGKFRMMLKNETEGQWQVQDNALVQKILTSAGTLEEVTLDCACLIFVTRPIWMIRVSFSAPEECEVHLMLHQLGKEEQKERAYWISFASANIPATTPKLLGLLNDFIVRELIVKSETGLHAGAQAEAVKADYLSHRN